MDSILYTMGGTPLGRFLGIHQRRPADLCYKLEVLQSLRIGARNRYRHQYAGELKRPARFETRGITLNRPW